MERARVWREVVAIPTYEIGEPQRNPMFLKKRVYQGSSGAVYPYPVIESVADKPTPQEWEAVYLENEYLKVMVLPQLGGRVQMALDKTNDYHFVYYNRVIKPALVGLAGPWISGGIEFNWPQHHRPNTYGPVESSLEEGEDGSATVWCSEIERMHGTKGMHGLTLRPGKAYLEINAKLVNRTDLPQTFLWWANPAIAVDENHQSMFPLDVHAVMDHGKRDSISFPIARGEYYKVDYSAGVDISRYANVPAPTSYMAHHSDYDFVGTYDHGRQAGMVHVCDHHVSPGKKQWTWGHGEFGRAWDRRLTDEDGPYIELMCGVYTDNQPDFSWLMPGEQKAFTQRFMPYKGVGRIGNANSEAVIGFELNEGQATVRAYVTSERPGATLVLDHAGKRLLEQAFDGSPRHAEVAACQVAEGVKPSDLRVAVLNNAGEELVAWRPESAEPHAVPEPAAPIGPPQSLGSNEALYLAGKHLQQYRHATRDPEPYFREALRRDPGDSRCNTALADLLIRRYEYEAAAEHACAAVERVTRHNPNPYDGEPHYLLGVACERLGRHEAAYDAYRKAMWNAAWRPLAGLAAGRLALSSGDLTAALEHARETLRHNSEDPRAQHLEVVTLRLLGEADTAKQCALAAVQNDPLHAGALWELYAAGENDWLLERLRDEESNYLELACDYRAIGQLRAAEAVLSCYLGRVDAPATPMPHYHRASLRDGLGDHAGAQADRQLAMTHEGACCFPSRHQDALVLSQAIKACDDDARAPYYLACLYYHVGREEEAISLWRRSLGIDDVFPIAWRNLGLAYFNVKGDQDGARAAYERAFNLAPHDARVLYELDQLARRAGECPKSRLERLRDHPELVRSRDDLFLEWITLLNHTGKPQQALDALLSKSLQPWEGGEGKAPRQYVGALSALARTAIQEGDPNAALDLLEQARLWPASLGEGKLPGNCENDLDLLQGDALSRLGRSEEARAAWRRAAEGDPQPASAVYYNDQPPEMIFYQGLALLRLGRDGEAAKRFARLTEYGREHLEDEPEIDFFAVSLPDFLVFEDDLTRRNRTHCLHMIALGAIGRGESEAALEALAEIGRLDPSHPGLQSRVWLTATTLGA